MSEACPGVEAEEILPRSDMVDFADETIRPKEAGSVGSVGRSFRQKGVKPYRGVGGDFWSVVAGLTALTACLMVLSALLLQGKSARHQKKRVLLPESLRI